MLCFLLYLYIALPNDTTGNHTYVVKKFYEFENRLLYIIIQYFYLSNNCVSFLSYHRINSTQDYPNITKFRIISIKLRRLNNCT